MAKKSAIALTSFFIFNSNYGPREGEVRVILQMISLSVIFHRIVSTVSIATRSILSLGCIRSLSDSEITKNVSYQPCHHTTQKF